MPHKKGHIKTGQGGKPLGSTTKRGGASKATTNNTTTTTTETDAAAAAAERKRKREEFWGKVQKTTAKGEELAAEAKRQRTLTGYSPQASSINKGGSGVYNYQPKQMSDKPGDTSPMVRFDSDYEKQKRSMGL